MPPSGNQVTEFSVATIERRKDGDVTTWFRVSTFGKGAETAGQYLRKGSYVYVEARSPCTHTPVATASSGSRWRYARHANARQGRRAWREYRASARSYEHRRAAELRRRAVLA
jgi:hypothetical protein